MNTTQREPRSNVFCLTGILASLLLMTGLLTDGNAHTTSFTTVLHSTVFHEYRQHADSASQMAEPQKKEHVKPAHKSRSHKDDLLQDQEKDAQPGKKRMGLALLFLGILAEEG